ncbi:hypothetical protein SK128_006455 [Halocaridina rubra]|uniref:Uncharacterized protein n=1 Tax=Halocaridina rubra TaxID=373956 RepID=A0AAN9A533_HALRR
MAEKKWAYEACFQRGNAKEYKYVNLQGREEYSRLLYRYKRPPISDVVKVKKKQPSEASNITEASGSPENRHFDIEIDHIDTKNEFLHTQIDFDNAYSDRKTSDSEIGSADQFLGSNLHSVASPQHQVPFVGFLPYIANHGVGILDYAKYLNNLPHEKDETNTDKTLTYTMPSVPILHSLSVIAYPSNHQSPIRLSEVGKVLNQIIRNSTEPKPDFGGINKDDKDYSILGGKVPEKSYPNFFSSSSNLGFPEVLNSANANNIWSQLESMFPSNILTQLLTSNKPLLTLTYLSKVLESLPQELAFKPQLSPPNIQGHITAPDTSLYPLSQETAFGHNQDHNVPEKDLILYLYKRCQQDSDVQHIPDSIFWDIVSQLSSPSPRVKSVLRQKKFFNVFDHMNFLADANEKEKGGRSSTATAHERRFNDLSSESSVHECMKDTWCVLGLAAIFSIGTGSALAVPVVSKVDIGRQRRTANFVVLSPDTATDFTRNYVRLLKNDSFNVPDSLKLLFTALHDANDDSARNVFYQIEQFIRNNKDKLLYITIEEIKTEKNISYKNIAESPISEIYSGASVTPIYLTEQYSSPSDIYNLNVFTDRNRIYSQSPKPLHPVKYPLNFNSSPKTSISPLFVHYGSNSPKFIQQAIYQVSDQKPIMNPYPQHEPVQFSEIENQKPPFQLSSICEKLKNNREIIKTIHDSLHQSQPAHSKVTVQPAYQYTFNYINRPLAAHSNVHQRPVNTPNSQTTKLGNVHVSSHNHHLFNIQHSHAAPVKSYTQKFSTSQTAYHPLSFADKQAIATVTSTEKPTVHGSDILNHLGTKYSSILLKLPHQFNPLSNPLQFITPESIKKPPSSPQPMGYPSNTYYFPNFVASTPSPSLPLVSYQYPSTHSSYTEYHQDSFHLPYAKNKFTAHVNHISPPLPSPPPVVSLNSDILIIPPGNTKPNVSLQAKGFYRSVCAAVSRNGVPDNEIIRFIAEKCAIFQYSGIV